jgi:AcrR family transcriptional regulator
MRRLAEELETAPASLYRHVASRDDLLRLVGEQTIADIDLHRDPGATWQERTIA